MRFVLLLATLVAVCEARSWLHPSVRRRLAQGTTLTQSEADGLIGVWKNQEGSDKFFSSQLAILLMEQQFRDGGKVDGAEAFGAAQNFSNIAQAVPGSRVTKMPTREFVIYGADASTFFWAGGVLARDGDKLLGAQSLDGFLYEDTVDGVSTVQFEGGTADGQVTIWGMVNPDGTLWVEVTNRLTPASQAVDMQYIATATLELSDVPVNEALTEVADAQSRDFEGDAPKAPGGGAGN